MSSLPCKAASGYLDPFKECINLNSFAKDIQDVLCPESTKLASVGDPKMNQTFGQEAFKDLKDLAYPFKK